MKFIGHSTLKWTPDISSPLARYQVSIVSSMTGSMFCNNHGNSTCYILLYCWVLYYNSTKLHTIPSTKLLLSLPQGVSWSLLWIAWWHRCRATPRPVTSLCEHGSPPDAWQSGNLHKEMRQDCVITKYTKLTRLIYFYRTAHLVHRSLE